MSKKILNEEINGMKYLFGYKPGRVISEQDYDYTTDDYLNITELELDEKRHPMRFVRDKKSNRIVGEFKKGDGFKPYKYGIELGFEPHPERIPPGTVFGPTQIGDFDYEDDDFSRDNPFDDLEITERIDEQKTDRYMFFSNLEQIHRQTGLLLEKDPQMISDVLENGHDWAQDHIATAKESIDQVFDFLMNEESGESDKSNMVMNEDLEFDEEETTESILKKHNLFDEADIVREDVVKFLDKGSDVIKRFLDILPLLTKIEFVSIAWCGFADFSGVDVCSLPNLSYIALIDTRNNLEELSSECVFSHPDEPYIFYINF